MAFDRQQHLCDRTKYFVSPYSGMWKALTKSRRFSVRGRQKEMERKFKIWKWTTARAPAVTLSAQNARRRGVATAATPCRCLPLHAVLNELVRGQALAKLRATAVDALVKPTVGVDADRLYEKRGQSEARE